jgi:cell division protein FtsI/penicillin-binding protein 2
VFKVFTLAAGLDSGKIPPGLIMNDPGSITIGGRRFYNSDRSASGDVDLVTAMEKSLNVIAAKIALSTGPRVFYNYLHDFGFGSMTHVDLAGEIPGTVKNPGDGIWYESDLGTNSFGQGIATTPIQMATALGAVANGGNLMRPYIVDRVIYPDGSVDPRAPRIVRRVLKPGTSEAVIDILSRSIGEESTNKANLEGYKIAGKTGTAQIPVPGGYDQKWTIASFGGFFPADNPQYVILVKIDRPSKSPWGSQVASPIFANVARQLTQLTGLPPDGVRAAQQ